MGVRILKIGAFQQRTPIDPPAKTLSGHFPHEWGKLGAAVA